MTTEPLALAIVIYAVTSAARRLYRRRRITARLREWRS